MIQLQNTPKVSEEKIDKTVDYNVEIDTDNDNDLKK